MSGRILYLLAASLPPFRQAPEPSAAGFTPAPSAGPALLPGPASSPMAASPLPAEAPLTPLAFLPWAFALAGVLALALVGVCLWLLWRRRQQPRATAPVTPLPLFQLQNLHGIGSREEQQDSFGISPLEDPDLLAQRGLLAVVADGMGGLEGGAQVSQLAVNTFLQGFATQPPTCDLLLKLTRQAQENALAYLNTHALEGGSTLVAVWVWRGALRYATVGDSRLYLLRGDELRQLNTTHTYGQQLDAMVTSGKITPEEAAADPQRGALTSYLGKEHLTQIDQNREPLPLWPGDRLLLLSDGVFNTLTEAEICAALGTTGLNGAALETALLSKARPHQDNYTAVLLGYEGPAPTP